MAVSLRNDKFLCQNKTAYNYTVRVKKYDKELAVSPC